VANTPACCDAGLLTTVKKSFTVQAAGVRVKPKSLFLFFSSFGVKRNHLFKKIRLEQVVFSKRKRFISGSENTSTSGPKQKQIESGLPRFLRRPPFRATGASSRSPCSSRLCRYPGHSLNKRACRRRLRRRGRRSGAAWGAPASSSPDNCSSKSTARWKSLWLRREGERGSSSSRPIGTRLPLPNRPGPGARMPEAPAG
jgi:hypothetical protein